MAAPAGHDPVTVAGDDGFTGRLRDEDVARIVDALEERILAELDRRGGRLAGLL